MNTKSKNLISRILLSINVVKAFKNWPLYFLTYFGFFKGKKIEYRLRNGIKFLAVDNHSRLPISEVWICKTYTPSNFSINERDVVVDLGAHIGAFSIYAATKAARGKIYAYEPVAGNFKVLRHNIKLNNLNNIIPFNLGISNSKGVKKIYLSTSSTTSSLLGWPFGQGDKWCLVKVIELKNIFEDNGLKKINFLKMDCEGSEYEIMFNTPKKYLDKIDRVALEYHEGEFTKYGGRDLETFFRSHNFKVVMETAETLKDPSLKMGMLYAWRKR